MIEYRQLEEIDYTKLVVTCYTPNGNAIEVQASNEEHADFLLMANCNPRFNNNHTTWELQNGN